MPLKDHLWAANLVEGKVWKVAALKSSNSCNQLIALGRGEPRCRAEEMLGHMRTAGRLPWWRQADCPQSSRGTACQQRIQKAVSPCCSDGLQVFLADLCMYILCMGLATPTVTSFLVSQLLPLLPSIPAAFLTLPTTQVLLVRSPARPDCKNWLTWSPMLSRANDFFLLDHAYLSSWELKDSYGLERVICMCNVLSK